jgi:hypothetical protein
VQDVAIEPRRLELVRRQLDGGAAIRRHRAVTGRRDADDDAGAASNRSRELDTVCAQLLRDDLAGRVVAPPADVARVGSQRACPRGDVGRLAAGARARYRDLVVAGHERLLQLHDHIQEEVAEGRQPHE